jgi:hypothetical protein
MEMLSPHLDLGFWVAYMTSKQYLLFGILLGSPLAVAKAAATLPGFHTKYET